MNFDLRLDRLENGMVLEASAGTGKTWTISSLVAREIAADDDLAIGNVLITTFTRAAAAELRERVRARLIEAAVFADPDIAESESTPGSSAKASDPLRELLTAGSAEDRRRRAQRLRRAVVDFDNAVIGTIHSICSRILALAGEPHLGMDDNRDTERLEREVVNDALVAEAGVGNAWDPGSFRAVIRTLRNRPGAVAWISSEIAPHDQARLQLLRRRLEAVLSDWDDRARRQPSFNELVQRAAGLLDGPGADIVRARVREKVKLVFVDEAQDTDGLQWRLFHGLFPPSESDSGARLVAVGDPKQAIYSFRGADVHAYLDVRNPDKMRTLGTNFRSDRPLVDALNQLFDGARFGEEIGYQSVQASPGKSESRLTGAAPVSIVDVGVQSAGMQMADAAARRVRHLLGVAQLTDDKGVPHPLCPRDICVLARTNAVAARVQRILGKWRIPSVNSGTESVFAGEMAASLGTLLTVMARLADMGNVRRVAASVFFGHALDDPALFPDDMREAADPGAAKVDVLIPVQEKLALWKQQLAKGGVAALIAAIRADTDVMRRLLAGPSGERRLTDLSHIAEIWQEETAGKGIAPDALRAIHDRLATLPNNSDLVARRVESDADAVQIMTIHRSKGLQFPVVVVADGWKRDKNLRPETVPAFRRMVEASDIDLNPGLAGSVGEYRTLVDIGRVTDTVAKAGAERALEEIHDERRRLLYVALTRPEHHLSLLWPSLDKESLLDSTLQVAALRGEDAQPAPGIEWLNLGDIPVPSVWSPEETTQTVELSTADAPEPVGVTQIRVSFTSLVASHDTRAPAAPSADPGESGTDEGDAPATAQRGYAGDDHPLGVDAMPLARIRGGTDFGRRVHRIFELLDPAVDDLDSHVQEICAGCLDTPSWRPSVADVAGGIGRALRTPLGPILGNQALADFGASQRLCELSFDIGAALGAESIRVRDIGELLLDYLPDHDPLRGYARRLAHPSFFQPVAGVVTGSVDAVLQRGTDSAPRLVLVDYKTNRLDNDGHRSMIDAYGQAGVWKAMEEHHYPLQFLLYGAVLHRFLRWRLPDADIDGAIEAVAYCFVRGMVGPRTPVDSAGNPAGVFAWRVPRGLFARLSDLLAGNKGA